MDHKLLEIKSSSDCGYNPLVYFESWRVAILNDADRFRKENITTLERHNTSDELFVLLSGQCTLYVGDGADDVGAIHGVEMEPNYLYVIKKGVWHNCVTSEGTKLLIVENADVSNENSDKVTASLAGVQ